LLTKYLKQEETVVKRIIKSTWRCEKGRWDGRNFVDRQWIALGEKELEMEIISLGPESVYRDPIIRFYGGPTGHESYYIADLLRNLEFKLECDDFSICAGTINSWPECRVSFKEVIDFIKVFNTEGC
jgi:hypothetical protein